MNDILKSIAENWKLEAKFEDTHKYFYNYQEVNDILNKDKCYVIGRKGSGKSAICEHIIKCNEYNRFATKLNFKNFPFNELYELTNSGYTPPNQYITLWKYLIYSTVCKLMVSNENINSEIRTELEKLYPNNTKPLARTIQTWTSAEFGASILGNGGTIKIERDCSLNTTPWIERVNILEDIIFKYCDDSTYYIVFDELDEDYRSVNDTDSSQPYIYLLTSLFKAVQDVKSTFIDSGKQIKPIIFLRDDIYMLIKDSDKNKWRDMKIELEWTEDKLKDLLSYRISKDIPQVTQILPFKDSWNKIFNPKPVNFGNKQGKKIDSFDFIARSTQLRPRDFIQYIQCCAEEALRKQKNDIQEATIKFVDRAFSNYLKDEIIDEVFPLLPEIEKIMQIISNIRKWNFSCGEFEHEYKKYLKSNTIHEKNIDLVLDILYNFSIIGNQHKLKKDTFFFKYQHTNMTFNKEENIVIHRGLFKAFQL